jgi:SAM-dependent methyltransferase
VHEPDVKSAAEALLQAVALKGRRVIEIGCGDGQMVRFMTAQGASVIGIDPGPRQLEKARAAAAAGGERYIAGVGERLPLPDASADLVVFVNSLHHVPVAEQASALQEAARVLVDGGALYIAEPQAQGPQFELMRPIDDETEVRAAAYAQISRAPDFGFELVWERRHRQPRRIESFEALRDGSIAIDPSRAAKFAALEDDLRAALARLTARLSDGSHEVLQPIRVDLLRRRSRAAADPA